MYKSHLKRIIYNPLKVLVIVMMIAFPVMEVFQLVYQLKDFELTGSIYKLFFLSGASRGHLFQIIYLWILPLYLLFVVSDDSCTDEKSGYKYILLSKLGRKKYLIEKWKTSFGISFFIMFISLILNMILVYIIFANRCSDVYLLQEMMGVNETLKSIFINYPLLSYFVYVIIASVISGLVGILGSVISTTFRERKYVYAITFLLWLIFIVKEESIMLVFQPYIEFPISMLLKIFGAFLLVCITFLVGAMIYEKKRVCE